MVIVSNPAGTRRARDRPRAPSGWRAVDISLFTSLIQSMGDNSSARRVGSTRRAFLSTSAIAAAGIPLLTNADSAAASPLAGPPPDVDLRDMLKHVDPARMEATVQRLVSFGT